MYQGKYAAPSTKKPRKKQARSKGTTLFYGAYILMIVVCFIGIGIALSMLGNWLVRFEASQPDTKSQEVFQQLFSDPDWEQLYDMADFQNTLFETKASYAAYMENKVGDQELTYVKTSAGLSGGHKYIVRLGDENLGTFTLQNQVTGDLEIPDWTLDSLELFMTLNQDVTIQTQPGHTVSVNGIPMSDDFIVATTTTVLDQYAPEGYHGDRTVTYYTSGLLAPPVVEITDENGNRLEHNYDPATNTYYELFPAKPEISKSEYDAVLGATQSYAKYMIGVTGVRLNNYFNTESDLYKSIKDNELWFKGWTGYEFGKETISEYYRYSDDMFSARIEITLNVRRAQGTVKKFDIDHTFFVKKNSAGVWKVYKMTNANLQEVITNVRLTFKVGDQVIHQGMYNALSTNLQTPSVTVPEGQQFLGWFQEVKDDNGGTTLKLLFQPDENGNVSLPHGYVLKHMVLIARFGKEGA